MVKVGVILDQNNELTSLIDGVRVAVYENINSKWTIIRDVKDCFLQKASINQMRDFLKLLIVELKDCKILVGSVITGIPFMILDKEGFMLCEAEEMSENLLSSVASDFKNMQQKKKNITVYQLEEYPTSPYKTQVPGEYEFDMRRFHKQYPEVSSKKALIPFFKETEFVQLNIYCNHVMPWFDFELPAHGLKYYAERLEGGDYKVLIEHMNK